MLISSERLEIREIIFNDWFEYFSYASDSEVARLAGFKPIPDMEVAKKIVTGMVYRGDTYAIFLRDSKKFIGTINLTPGGIRKIKGVYTIGISLKKEFWGMGFGQEAIKSLINYAFTYKKANYIEIMHEIGNARSQNMILKSGFIHDGNISDYDTLWNGEVYSISLYSINAKNYQKEKKYGKNIRHKI